MGVADNLENLNDAKCHMHPQNFTQKNFPRQEKMMHLHG